MELVVEGVRFEVEVEIQNGGPKLVYLGTSAHALIVNGAEVTASVALGTGILGAGSGVVLPSQELVELGKLSRAAAVSVAGRGQLNIHIGSDLDGARSPMRSTPMS